MVGDRDGLGLVLDDEHGVALVAQLQQQFVHALDVVRVQSDRRLVEHVGDIGERRPEVPDHLGALRLAARERTGCPVEAQVAESDVDERLECLAQRAQQRSDAGVVEAAHPLGEVADLHRAGIRDVDPLDLRGAGALVQSRAAAVRARGERDRALDEGADVRLHGLDILRQERLLHVGDEPEVGHVDAGDLDLGRLLVEEVVSLGLGEVLDRLVGGHESRLGEDPHAPAVGRVAGDGQGALLDRLVLVEQLA